MSDQKKLVLPLINFCKCFLKFDFTRNKHDQIPNFKIVYKIRREQQQQQQQQLRAAAEQKAPISS